MEAGGHITTYSYQAHASTQASYPDSTPSGEKAVVAGGWPTDGPVRKAGLNHEGAWHTGTALNEIRDHSGL